VETLKPETAVTPRTNVQDTRTTEEDDEPVYDYHDDEDDGLGLQRYASASAAPPRRLSPPPAEDVPALSGSDSDEDDEDPPSPPSLPEDVARKMVLEGEDDEALNKLYNQIKSCTCGPQHKDAPVSKGIKTGMYEGRRVGIVTVEA
jgi:hypothetical protein